jgi:hypothetical protein
VLEGWRTSPSLGLSFVIGFYLTLIGGLIGLIILFASASQMGPKVSQVLRVISVGALLLFGVYQIWAGVVTLM